MDGRRPAGHIDPHRAGACREPPGRRGGHRPSERWAVARLLDSRRPGGTGVGCTTGKWGVGARLRAGMVLAIEPMVNLGGAEVMVLEDGWTAVTLDRKPSAHFEHSVAITDEGPWVLSAPLVSPAARSVAR